MGPPWWLPVLKNLPVTQEMQIQSLGQEDLLEKDMATHSSILAWRIPWIEDPGGLQSMGLQMVRHTEATLHTHPWSYLPEASKVFTKTRKMERK